jgi:hypothetical protein
VHAFSVLGVFRAQSYSLGFLSLLPERLRWFHSTLYRGAPFKERCSLTLLVGAAGHHLSKVDNPVRPDDIAPDDVGPNYCEVPPLLD